MLEEPSSQDVDRSFRQPSLRPPRFGIHHPHLVNRLLLPELLVKQSQARRFSFGQPGRPRRIFLSQQPVRLLQLHHYRVLYAPEMPGHGLLRQRRVRRRGAVPEHGVERGHHDLHLVAVSRISPVHLLIAIQTQKGNCNYYKSYQPVKCHEYVELFRQWRALMCCVLA